MADGRRKPTGQGYNFMGEKAQIIKARLKEIREETKRTGRTSILDPKPRD